MSFNPQIKPKKMSDKEKLKLYTHQFNDLNNKKSTIEDTYKKIELISKITVVENRIKRKTCNG